MSYYMVFNSWSGDDSATAIEKMSRVFRMDEDHASKILDDLSAGETWQFEHQVSDKQSEIAESYLQGLGFDMERIPIMDDEQDMMGGEAVSGEKSDKKFVVTVLLGLFLGILGAHRFYVGKTLSGVLMLLTLGGLFIWAIIDNIMIALGKFTDSKGRKMVMTSEEASGVEVSDKKFGPTILLVMFLGLLGAHRFYVGKPVTGVLMLLTLGGLGIWLFIDQIMIALGQFKDSKGRKILS